eukprot:g3557.t1
MFDWNSISLELQKMKYTVSAEDCRLRFAEMQRHSRPLSQTKVVAAPPPPPPSTTTKTAVSPQTQQCSSTSSSSTTKPKMVEVEGHLAQPKGKTVEKENNSRDLLAEFDSSFKAHKEKMKREEENVFNRIAKTLGITEEELRVAKQTREKRKKEVNDEEDEDDIRFIEHYRRLRCCSPKSLSRAAKDPSRRLAAPRTIKSELEQKREAEEKAAFQALGLVHQKRKQKTPVVLISEKTGKALDIILNDLESEENGIKDKTNESSELGDVLRYLEEAKKG